MSTYKLHTDQSWASTKKDLATTFQKWHVHKWEVCCPSAPRSVDSWSTQPQQDRTVTVEWTSADGAKMKLSLDTQARNIDNLRALYLAIESIRMNEKRGVSSDVMREAYLQLAPPSTERDPWDVLELRPGTNRGIIDAVYRTLAKQRHPDTGGSEDGFKELQRAYEAVTGTKVG